MGQRSRKRGRRSAPEPVSHGATAVEAPQARTARAAAVGGRQARGELRNAALRATLKPYEPGERPWSIKIAALAAFLIGAVQLVLFLAGVKLKVSGTHAKAGSTIVFGLLMFACAIGVWLKKYWAVLGFMALLALFSLYFALALIKVSSFLGLLIALAGLGLCGSLFYKLVRVLSRIQMPRYPTR